MKSDIRLELPATFDMILHVTNGETKGTITIGLPVGRFPTKDAIQEAIEHAKKNGVLQAGNYRPMTKPEFWEQWCLEEYGQRFALPNGAEWDQ